MIRIYFSPLTPGCEPVPLAQACVPGWRVNDPKFSAHFEKLFREASEHWQVVPMAQAQVAVFTDRYVGGAAAEAFSASAHKAGIPCLFFDTSDEHTPRQPEHGLVYRSAIFRSRLTPAERATPPIYEDMLRYHGGQAQPRAYNGKAVVGFCGYVPPAWKPLLQMLRGQPDKSKGQRVRQVAVKALARSPLIATNFVIRQRYWGGAIRAGNNAALLAKVRQEFVENLFDCDYVLCARGAGNYSFRLYEALSAGRIPLLIDTDCCLPLSDRIDWRRHSVFVDEARIHDAARILADFHAGLSAERFLALQTANRELSDTFLNPLSFLKIIVEEAVRGVRPAGPFG